MDQFLGAKEHRNLADHSKNLGDYQRETYQHLCSIQALKRKSHGVKETKLYVALRTKGYIKCFHKSQKHNVCVCVCKSAAEVGRVKNKIKEKKIIPQL